MATDYRQKCDNCDKDHPERYIEVRSDNNGYQREYWCLECIRGNK